MSGVFESPSPRKILPRMLYATMTKKPAPQIEIYCVVCVNAAAGAFITPASIFLPKIVKNVSIIAMMPKKVMPVPIVSPAFSVSPRPIC